MGQVLHHVVVLLLLLLQIGHNPSEHRWHTSH
jgi:hypothetical protein